MMSNWNATILGPPHVRYCPARCPAVVTKQFHGNLERPREPHL